VTYNGLTYEENTSRWKKRYPLKARRFNIRWVTAYRICRACGSTESYIHRHHKAQDYFFACMRPDRYAKDYIRFYKMDCDFLCKRCHDDVHKYRPYRRVIDSMLLIAWKRRDKGKRLKLTLKQCEDAKRKLRKVYSKWLKRRRKRNGLS